MEMKRAFVSGVSTLLLLLESGPALGVPEATPVTEPMRIVFTQEESERQAGRATVYGEMPGPYWTPSESQVLELEQRLPDFLKSSKEPRANLIPSKLGKYKRQYYGFTAHGKKHIFLNAFCSSVFYPSDYWKSHFVLVMDGGECYFQAIYDPAEKQFTSVWVNGYA
jgi:hypothetical protein